LIRTRGGEFLTAETGAVAGQRGHFTFDAVPEDKTYFVFVMPSPDDNDHLPGGDLSRKAMTTQELISRGSLEIRLSSGKFSAAQNNKFVGSHSCVECHQDLPNWQQVGKHWNKTAHKLGWSVPGAKGGDQDFSRAPMWFKALEHWPLIDGENVGPVEPKCMTRNAEEERVLMNTHFRDYVKICPPRPTHLEFGFNEGDSKKRDTAVFRVREKGDARVKIDTVYGDIFLWRRMASGGKEKYFITIWNRLNPSDAAAKVDLEIKLVYGGGVHRQRYVVSVPEVLAQIYGARKGHYTILQFNSDGDDRRWNKDRRVWRDYKISHWWDFGDPNNLDDDKIKAPDVNKNTIEAECAGCHVPGAERKHNVSGWNGQIKIKAFTDENGAFDFDQDGVRDEVNVGCESCHGPGNLHNQAIQTPVDGKSRIGVTKIINPKFLSAARADLICGRCHDRRAGKAKKSATQAVNLKEQFFPAGDSRQAIVTEYSAAGKAGPSTTNKKDLWPDNIHSRRPRQQYSEHVKSAHYRNRDQLVTCSDCHNAHGDSPYPTWLTGDPKDPYSPLCQSCHQKDSAQHQQVVGHPRIEVGLVSCISCHMVGTSRPGGDSGQYGLFAKRPPFSSLKDEQQAAYWEGNLNSHVFDVPNKISVGVWGIAPDKAMPIPYTNSCGFCHDVSAIPSGKPGDLPKRASANN